MPPKELTGEIQAQTTMVQPPFQDTTSKYLTFPLADRPCFIAAAAATASSIFSAFLTQTAANGNHSTVPLSHLAHFRTSTPSSLSLPLPARMKGIPLQFVTLIIPRSTVQRQFHGSLENHLSFIVQNSIPPPEYSSQTGHGRYAMLKRNGSLVPGPMNDTGSPRTLEMRSAR